MDLLNLWLPLVGGGVFLAIAIGGWFADHKVVGVWFGFAGGVCLLLLAALQVQEGIRTENHPSDATVLAHRAFVGLKRFIYEPVIENGVLVAWRVPLEWENQGNGSAFNVWMNSSVLVQLNELPADFDFPDYEIQTQGIGPLGRGSTRESGSNLLIPAGLIKQIRDRQLKVYIWGWVEYDDGVPGTPRRRTEVAAQVTVTGSLVNVANTTFRFDSIGRHNGADDQCLNPLRTPRR